MQRHFLPSGEKGDGVEHFLEIICSRDHYLFFILCPFPSFLYFIIERMSMETTLNEIWCCHGLQFALQKLNYNTTKPFKLEFDQIKVNKHLPTPMDLSFKKGHMSACNFICIKKKISRMNPSKCSRKDLRPKMCLRLCKRSVQMRYHGSGCWNIPRQIEDTDN